MSASVPTMPTVGEIARRLGQPTHRIEYLIVSRNIQPAGLAGHARVFTDKDVVFIESEIKRIDEDSDRAKQAG